MREETDWYNSPSLCFQIRVRSPCDIRRRGPANAPWWIPQWTSKDLGPGPNAYHPRTSCFPPSKNERPRLQRLLPQPDGKDCAAARRAHRYEVNVLRLQGREGEARALAALPPRAATPRIEPLSGLRSRPVSPLTFLEPIGTPPCTPGSGWSSSPMSSPPQSPLTVSPLKLRGPPSRSMTSSPAEARLSLKERMFVSAVRSGTNDAFK